MLKIIFVLVLAYLVLDKLKSIFQVKSKSNSKKEILVNDSNAWINQSGGFDALSEKNKQIAIQSHADWVERNPEKHTFDLKAYVEYVQERKAVRSNA